MSTEVWILVATAVLAVVAIGAAVIAVRAARRLAATLSTSSPAPIEVSREVAPVRRPTGEVTIHTPTQLPPELEPRLVEGRLIVPPTQHQVVQTALGRPGVRLSVLAHGLAHALRPESRDRISALMRREYRRRRRERAHAGRRAVRAAQPTPPSDQWLGS
ncbi:MAG: hypothetical protein JWR27_528 [Aeromicrobium sp.]|nr:hypothetical protein [Aeromicrobium sp.]